MGRHAVRRRTRRWPVLVTALTVAAGVVVASTSSAGADTSTGWVYTLPPSDSGVLTSTPSGGVEVTSRGGDYALQLNTGGTVDWQDQAVNPTYLDHPAVYDSTGNAYYVRCTASCTVEKHAPDGHRLWPTDGQSDLPSLAQTPIAISPDNLVYAMTTDSHLVGLRVDTGANAFTPAAVTDPPSGDQRALYPYSGGVAILSAASVTYYSAQGALINRYQLPQGNYTFTSSGSADGTVFVLQGNCDNGLITITRVTATGGASPSAQVQAAACANEIGYPPDIAALPDGGAAIGVAPSGEIGTGLTVLNSDGTVRWAKALPLAAGTQAAFYAPDLLRVDTLGNIVQGLSSTWSCQLGSDRCWAAQVFTYTSSGDAEPPIVLQKQDPNPESWGNPFSGLAVAPGAVYVSLGHSNGGQYSSTESDYQLRRIAVPPLGNPYPDAALWGTMSLDISPHTATAPINTAQSETALLKLNGSPVAGATIHFAVTSGPCVGMSADRVTGTAGSATWSYSCGIAGTDTISAITSAVSGGGGSGSATATATVTWTVPNAYVALGDSFSSGEGAVPDPILSPDYLVGTNVDGDQCHRSPHAYSEMLSGKHSKFPADLSFHACSGALIQDFYAPFASNHMGANFLEPHPQLDWLDASTKVLTLTIGGNNALFPDVMDYCAQRSYFEVSCKSLWFAAVNSAIRNLAMGTTRGTDDNLPDLYRDIYAKAPNATVYVLGYPRLFPKKPPQLCLTGAPGHTVLPPYPQFTKSDMLWINDETKSMNKVIADSARVAGFTFVPVYDAFNGHELCSGLTNVKWVHRVVLQLPFGTQQSFHPNMLGQQAFMRALVLASGSPN